MAVRVALIGEVPLERLPDGASRSDFGSSTPTSSSTHGGSVLRRAPVITSTVVVKGADGPSSVEIRDAGFIGRLAAPKTLSATWSDREREDRQHRTQQSQPAQYQRKESVAFGSAVLPPGPQGGGALRTQARRVMSLVSAVGGGHRLSFLRGGHGPGGDDHESSGSDGDHAAESDRFIRARAENGRSPSSGSVKNPSRSPSVAGGRRRSTAHGGALLAGARRSTSATASHPSGGAGRPEGQERGDVVSPRRGDYFQQSNADDSTYESEGGDDGRAAFPHTPHLAAVFRRLQREAAAIGAIDAAKLVQRERRRIARVAARVTDPQFSCSLLCDPKRVFPHLTSRAMQLQQQGGGGGGGGGGGSAGLSMPRQRAANATTTGDAGGGAVSPERSDLADASSYEAIAGAVGTVSRQRQFQHLVHYASSRLLLARISTQEAKQRQQLRERTYQAHVTDAIGPASDVLGTFWGMFGVSAVHRVDFTDKVVRRHTADTYRLIAIETQRYANRSDAFSTAMRLVALRETLVAALTSCASNPLLVRDMHREADAGKGRKQLLSRYANESLVESMKRYATETGTTGEARSAEEEAAARARSRSTGRFRKVDIIQCVLENPHRFGVGANSGTTYAAALEAALRGTDESARGLQSMAGGGGGNGGGDGKDPAAGDGHQPHAGTLNTLGGGKDQPLTYAAHQNLMLEVLILVTHLRHVTTLIVDIVEYERLKCREHAAVTAQPAKEYSSGMALIAASQYDESAESKHARKLRDNPKVNVNALISEDRRVRRSLARRLDPLSAVRTAHRKGVVRQEGAEGSGDDEAGPSGANTTAGAGRRRHRIAPIHARSHEAGDIPLPLLWDGRNYMITMQNDLAPLDETGLAELLSLAMDVTAGRQAGSGDASAARPPGTRCHRFTFAHNPFLLPTVVEEGGRSGGRTVSPSRMGTGLGSGAGTADDKRQARGRVGDTASSAQSPSPVSEAPPTPVAIGNAATLDDNTASKTVQHATAGTSPSKVFSEDPRHLTQCEVLFVADEAALAKERAAKIRLEATRAKTRVLRDRQREREAREKAALEAYQVLRRSANGSNENNNSSGASASKPWATRPRPLEDRRGGSLARQQRALLELSATYVRDPLDDDDEAERKRDAHLFEQQRLLHASVSDIVVFAETKSRPVPFKKFFLTEITTGVAQRNEEAFVSGLKQRGQAGYGQGRGANPLATAPLQLSAIHTSSTHTSSVHSTTGAAGSLVATSTGGGGGERSGTASAATVLSHLSHHADDNTRPVEDLHTRTLDADGIHCNVYTYPVSVYFPREVPVWERTAVLLSRSLDCRLMWRASEFRRWRSEDSANVGARPSTSGVNAFVNADPAGAAGDGSPSHAQQPRPKEVRAGNITLDRVRYKMNIADSVTDRQARTEHRGFPPSLLPSATAAAEQQASVVDDVFHCFSISWPVVQYPVHELQRRHALIHAELPEAADHYRSAMKKFHRCMLKIKLALAYFRSFRDTKGGTRLYNAAVGFHDWVKDEAPVFAKAIDRLLVADLAQFRGTDHVPGVEELEGEEAARTAVGGFPPLEREETTARGAVGGVEGKKGHPRHRKRGASSLGAGGGGIGVGCPPLAFPEDYAFRFRQRRPITTPHHNGNTVGHGRRFQATTKVQAEGKRHHAAAGGGDDDDNSVEEDVPSTLPSGESDDERDGERPQQEQHNEHKAVRADDAHLSPISANIAAAFGGGASADHDPTIHPLHPQLQPSLDPLAETMAQGTATSVAPAHHTGATLDGGALGTEDSPFAPCRVLQLEL